MTRADSDSLKRGRRSVVGTVRVLIAMPAVLALTEAAHFSLENRSNGSIVSSGRKREYLLYVPSSYDGAKPTPLVISMHGGGLWGTAQRELSRWNEVADQHDLIVVYPWGTDFPRMWHAVRPGPGLTADVRFISQLIDTLQAEYNIDPDKIYADGMSNGGGMAFVLACTLSNRIAAVAMVASAQFLPWSWCTDRRAVPMIAFHGTEDRLAPYHGGLSWVSPRPFANIPAWTAKWAERNRCARTAVESAVAVDVRRLDYPDCANDADVVLHTIIGGGHTWPGGMPLPEWIAGSTSSSIDATRLIWEFFRAHPLHAAMAGAQQP